MRPGQQNKRGRGRNNNNNNNNNNSGNNNNHNRKGSNPLTRTYDSSGPDVKIRGTAQHIAEKYSALARDAQSSGDRVIAENYLQHAEHYNRIIAAAQAQMQDRFQREERQDFRGQDANDQDQDQRSGRSGSGLRRRSAGPRCSRSGSGRHRAAAGDRRFGPAARHRRHAGRSGYGRRNASGFRPCGLASPQRAAPAPSAPHCSR